MDANPTPADVQRILDVDFETGDMRWKERPDSSIQVNARLSGALAGTQDSRGYLQVNLFGRLYLAHRVIWMLATGEWPTKQIDHINGDKTDNRISNLRLATRSENMMNRGRRRDNSSGFKGVSWNVARSKWVARICVDGKRHYLGYFDDPCIAHAKYCEAAGRMHGSFARIA